MKTTAPSLFERLRSHVWLLAAVWTLVIACSLLWNIEHHDLHTIETARSVAQIAFENDVLYRHWVAQQGGVYVRITDKTPPNPYLSVPDRDVTTTSGTKLTLFNPAYMARLVNESSNTAAGTRGRITSLKPLRPENAPDDWEAASLRAFEQGVKETSTVEQTPGGERLRLMRPFVIEPRCLKCHAQQGYKVGDIRGGISMSVSLATLRAAEHPATNHLAFAHAGLWLIGLVGIGVSRRKMGREVAAREEAEEQLRMLNAALESRVTQQTAELRKVNETLEQRIAERTAELRQAHEAAMNLTNDALIARERAEEAASALRASEADLQLALAAAHMGAWHWNIATGGIVWSPQCLAIHGLPAGTVMTYERFLQCVHPDDRERVAAALRGAVEEQSDYFIEKRIVLPGGTVRWTTSHGRCYCDGAGKPERMAGVTMDITERRFAEQALRQHDMIQAGVNQVLSAALTCKTEKELGDACLAIIKLATQSKAGFIGEVRDNLLHDIAVSNFGWDARDAVRPDSLYGRVLKGGKGFFINDPATHPDSIGLPDGQPPLQSFLGVPLLREGRAIGMIAVGNRDGGYTGTERETLEAMAPAIVEAFLRKRAERELVRTNRELERFNRAMVGRELRMVELKMEINKLLAAAGQPPRHIISGGRGGE